MTNARRQFDGTVQLLVAAVDLTPNVLIRRGLRGLDAIDRPVSVPFAVAFWPDGSRLYVVNSGSNDLSIIDLETALGVGHIELGDNPRGIVLTADPALILLDEPTAGMTAEEVDRTTVLIAEINKSAALIVVEHDMQFIKRIAHKVTVFHQGAILVEDSMDNLLNNQQVRDIYLGKKAA